MAQEIIDLDVVAGPPKKVKLGGRVWLLPADLPVEFYLRINQAEKDSKAAEARGEDEDEAKQFEEMRGLLLELFQIHQPTLRALPRELGLVRVLQAIPRIYGPPQTPDSEEPARPTRSRAAGTPSTPRRRTSRRSRSSRS